MLTKKIKYSSVIKGHSSADQKFPCCNKTYRFKTTIYKNPPVDQIQSQLNPFHTLTFSFYRISFNIILLSTSVSPNGKFIVNSVFRWLRYGPWCHFLSLGFQAKTVILCGFM